MNPSSRLVLPGLTLQQQLDDIRAFEARLREVNRLSKREHSFHRLIITTLIALWILTLGFVIFSGGLTAIWRLQPGAVDTASVLLLVFALGCTMVFTWLRGRFFPATEYIQRCNIVLRDYFSYFDMSTNALVSTRSGASLEADLATRHGFYFSKETGDWVANSHEGYYHYSSPPSSPGSDMRSRGASDVLPPFYGIQLNGQTRPNKQWEERMKDTSHPGGPIATASAFSTL